MKRILVILAALVLVATAASCGTETSTTSDSGGGSSGGSDSAKWVKVMTMKGSTAKTSPSFKLDGGEQKLKYTMKGKTMPAMAVYVEAPGWDMMEDGGFPVVTPDKAGSDSTMMGKDGGTYIAHVESANCTWTITILEKR